MLENLKHSYVDLDDPRRLEFDYIRWIGDAIDGAGAARRAARRRLPRRRGLHAAALPARHAPRLARAGARGRRRAGRPRARAPRAADGPGPPRRGGRRAGDARGRAPPPRPTCSSATRSAPARSLAPGDGRVRPRDPARAAAAAGVYALNLIDQPPLKLARAEVATLRAVFADVALVALPSAAGAAGRRQPRPARVRDGAAARASARLARRADLRPATRRRASPRAPSRCATSTRPRISSSRATEVDLPV